MAHNQNGFKKFSKINKKNMEKTRNFEINILNRKNCLAQIVKVITTFFYAYRRSLLARIEKTKKGSNFSKQPKLPFWPFQPANAQCAPSKNTANSKRRKKSVSAQCAIARCM